MPKDAPSAIDLLMEQHREVRALFDRYRDAPRSDKEKVFERLADILAAHSKIEETIFYPSVLAETTEHELRESVEEHLVAKRIIVDLMRMHADDPQFDAKVTVLEEVVDHHMDEEEHELFKIVRQIDGETLRAMGDMMKSAFDELVQEQPRQQLASEVESAASLPGS